jgi:serine/threonine-protein kinase
MRPPVLHQPARKTPPGSASRGGRASLAGLALILGLGASRPLLAQSNDTKLAAEALFDEGKQKLAQNDIAGACQAFEKSQSLDPGLGGLIYLADCSEKLGRLASAWSMYREAISLAKAAGQTELEALATRRSQALGPRLPKVKLQVAEGDTAGLVVKRDQTTVSRVLWGTELPIDPGTHQYEATAPGRKTWTLSVSVKEGEAPRVIEIPPLPIDPGASATPATSSVPAASSPPPAQSAAPPVSPPAPAPAWRTPTLIGMGVLTVAGVGFGAFFGMRARSQNNEASDLCRPEAPSQCKATGVAKGDDARRSAAASTISFAVGGAGLVGGLAVLLLTSSDKTSAETAGVRWQAGPGPGQLGLSLDGAW